MNEFEFDLPSVIPSTFASADSFRGRLVLIEVTGYERKVPNKYDPSAKPADRVTATVTTVDGRGPVQVYAQKAPTGTFLEGPDHEGVWFSQDRIVKAVAPRQEGSIGRKVLGVVETYQPGKPAGLGNPWGLVNPTPEQMQTARDFLAGRTVAQATAHTSYTDSDAGSADDPWAVKK